MSLNILITGGSGFLGCALSDFLNSEAEVSVNITWLTRNVNQSHPKYVTMMSYTQLQTTDALFDVIVNLAGAGIADKRWSDKRKRLLMQSRLQPTQAIVNYIAYAARRPKLLVSGSAIGWYGAQGNTPLDEHSDFENEFTHQLCEAWEKEASIATGLGVPVAILRTGVVMHPNGGMLSKLLPIFKIGLGGKLGNGKQIMSWISRDDWVRATWFIIQRHMQQPKVSGMDTSFTVYNLTAPHPVSNREFTAVISHWLRRRAFLTLPKWLLKMRFGEMSTLLIDGQRVLPQALLNAGFKFKRPVLKQALITRN